jgi:hypothetical protein
MNHSNTRFRLNKHTRRRINRQYWGWMRGLAGRIGRSHASISRVFNGLSRSDFIAAAIRRELARLGDPAAARL